MYPDYELMKDPVDLDMSGVLRGELSLQEAGKVIFDEVLAVAMTASPNRKR